MPFVRFTRDKRGYEHVYLVHAPVRRGKPGRPRVLYWYRSPPGVRVGREAFDQAVREALEAQYPDIAFEWEVLAAPPPPPPEVEPWRERRRLQKARRARGAAIGSEMGEPGASAESDDDPGVDEGADAQMQDVRALDVDLALAEPAEEPHDSRVSEPGNVVAVSMPAPAGASRGRRRRRGGRHRGRPIGEPGGPVAPAGSPGDPAPPDHESDPERGGDDQ